MDDLRISRFRRLHLESLEDRLAPTISPAFNDVAVPDTASVNQTANHTTPVLGAAADGSYVVAWQFNDPVKKDSDIFARRFNSDGTPKAAAFAVANSSADESQPAIAVAADGSFIVAYTRVVGTSAGSLHSVFFQMFDASGKRTLGETEAPAHSGAGTQDDFSPDVAVASSTGQFIVTWVQQSSANNRDVFARAFQADGRFLTFNDVAVGVTTGDEFNPHVAIKPNTSAPFAGDVISVISYTLNQGNGVQKVFFRRYASILSPLDQQATGIAVSGNDTSALEDQSALAMDTNGNVFITWSATPVSGGPSQVRFQKFDRTGKATTFSPGFVDAGNGLSQTAPAIALNGDGRFLIAFTGSGGSAPAQIYYREFSPSLQPASASRAFSDKTKPSNTAPHLTSSYNNLFILAADDLTGSSPDPITRGFTYLTSRVGVVRPNAAGLAQFSVDSNGNNKFDSSDSVFTFGFFTDQFVIGDWNGSGYDKIGVVRPFSGVAAIFSLDTNGDGKFDAGDQVFVFGRSTDQFLVGDWNGDGKAKVGVVRANGVTATFSLDTNGSGKFDANSSVFNFGLATDKFVIGDWNGDGRSKIGVVRADANGNAVWSLDTNGDGKFDAGDQVFTFGRATDSFIVGDWNGDGKSKIGVVRTGAGLSGGVTFIEDTNGNGVLDTSDQTFNFGQAGDKFVIGKWLPTAKPLQAASIGPGGVPALTDSELAATVQQAIDVWAAAGLDLQHLDLLSHVSVHISQLDGGLLGLAENNAVAISDDAAGWSWNTSAGTPLPNRMDLLTTMAHEFGHVLGLGDNSSRVDDVMAEALTPGVRRLPDVSDVDAVFAAMGTTHRSGTV